MELETQLIKGDQMVEVWSTFRRGEKDTWILREYCGVQMTSEHVTTSRKKVDGFISYLENMGFKRGAAGVA